MKKAVKKAVMYGAGVIGRGFVGAKLFDCGYDVTFVDVDDKVVDAINAHKKYPQITIGETVEEKWIKNVSAINGKDVDSVADAIANTDIMATSVGAAILPRIASVIALGLRKRWAINPDNTLDILICENLNYADKILFGLLKENLTEYDDNFIRSHVGLVETSIGCMAPVVSDEMKQKHELATYVEPYSFIPVDKNAFLGDVLEGPGIVPYSPFSFYLERKLFVHNMSHALTAYFGDMLNYEYIWQSADNPNIILLAKNAMLESALALHKKYDFPIEQIMNHIDDLLYRFGNKGLGDTCERVGRDPMRKIGENDRFAGAIKAALDQNVYPIHIAVGLSSAICKLLSENKNSDLEDLLTNTAKLDPSTPIYKDIVVICNMLNKSIDLVRITEYARKRKVEYNGPIA